MTQGWRQEDGALVRVRLSIGNLNHAGITHAELRLAAKVDAIVEWSFPAVPPRA
jgi:hypothetical protein